MKLCQLDHDPFTGDAPIGRALHWLQALIDSPAVPWGPMQREAAIAALLRAQARMHADVFIGVEAGMAVPKLLDTTPTDGLPH